MGKNIKWVFITIITNTIIAAIGLYAFYSSRLGMCIYWAIACLLAMWNLKTSPEEKVEAVVSIWKSISFILYLLLIIAFASELHTLALSSIVTLLFQVFFGAVFDDAIRKEKSNRTNIICSIPIIVSYAIMASQLCKGEPF